MNSTAVKWLSISTNGKFGRNYGCCHCDTFNEHGELEVHVNHSTLYYCQKEGCNHLSCKDHLMPCGYCAGCCFEEHGYEHK